MPNWTKQEIYDLENFILDNLKSISVNHTYPAEEKKWAKLLVLVKEVKPNG